MRNLKNASMLKNFDELPIGQRWDACLDALDKEYTMSLREACRILKSSREWVDRYIRPHVSYIYLSRGIGGKDGERKGNYYAIADRKVGLGSSDSIWLNAAEFENLIREHVTSYTRQAIVLPAEVLLQRECIEDFRQKVVVARQQYKDNRFEAKEVNDGKDFDDVIEDLINDSLDPGLEYVWKSRAIAHKRTRAEAVTIKPDPDFELNDMMAAHDMKEYGDTDETVYRKLFRMGCIRIEVKIPDASGHVSDKIFYVQPDDGFHVRHSVVPVLIRYQDYMQYKEVLTRWTPKKSDKVVDAPLYGMECHNI